MKLTKTKITAASDFRGFNGYDLEELKEMLPNIYNDYFYAIRSDIETAYVSTDPECRYVGAKDTHGDYYVYSPDELRWAEVYFTELSRYLSSNHTNTISTKKVDVFSSDYLQLYEDRDNVLGDDDIVSLGGAKTYWNQNYNSDPVLSEYNSFDEWWADTVDNYLVTL